MDDAADLSESRQPLRAAGQSSWCPGHLNDQVSAQHVEVLVLVVVLVPVEFAFENAQTYNGVIDFAKSLVEPGLVLGDNAIDVDLF